MAETVPVEGVGNAELAQATVQQDVLVAAYDELFGSAPTAYVQTDAGGVIIRYNDAARRVLALPAAPDGPLLFTSLLSPADRATFDRLVDRLRSGQHPFVGPIEATLTGAPGSATPVVIAGRRSSARPDGRPVLHWEVHDHSAGPAARPPDPTGAADAGHCVGAIAEAVGEMARHERPEAVLEQILEQARRLVPGCDECGAVLVRGRGRLEPGVCSDALAAACDRLQCELGEGPALAVLESGQVVGVPDASLDGRWPEFAARAVELGVGSILAVPLLTTRGPAGVLLFYAEAANAFGEPAETVASAFGLHAGIALAHAELEGNLRTGLETREEIGRAVGILMERHRITATAAFDMLVVASQHSHRKLRDVAAWMNETGEDPGKLVATKQPRSPG